LEVSDHRIERKGENQMASIVVRHKVKDYATWKVAYDDHRPTRKAAGCKGTVVYRSADDPSEVVPLFEWDSLENAKKFAGSDDLRETMERAGVSDQPDMYFLNEVDKTPQ
jgi:heme-degrading monooxygenase HmoA